MVNKSDWKVMKQHAFDTFARDGGMSVGELEAIVDIALADGEFDEDEKGGNGQYHF